MALDLKDGFRYDRVIFDVGGTLVGFHDAAPFREFLAAMGLPASQDHAHHLHQRLISVIVAERDNAQGLGVEEQEIESWWRNNVAAKTWPGRSDLAEEMVRWLFAGRFDRLFGDVVPGLRRLQTLGVPMAVLSNFGTHLWELLARLDLLRFFDFVIVSAEVGLAKPDPRIFDLVVEKAGRPRRRLLYVGDHIGDDIQGAQGAGLDAVLIDRGDRQRNALCPRIGSLLELADYLRPPREPAPAIIFDMDGVVLDSMPMHLHTWQQTLQPLGVALTADDLYPLEGIPTETTAQRLMEQFVGKACSADEAWHLAQAKRALFRKRFRPTLIPGMGPLLHDLHGRGYRLGLVTGSARSVVDESLVPTGVADLFDVVVTGDQVSLGKPDPEPYATAAGRLGLAPADCLVVENAPLGIQSAKAAGMACAALQTTLPAEWLRGADHLFSHVRELRTWLLSRWRQG